MRLVDQTSEISLRQGQRLLRIDLFDHRKLRRRQRGQREARFSRLDRYTFAVSRDRYRRFLGKRTEDIEQLAARNGDVAWLLNVGIAGGNQLHLEIRAGDADAVVPRCQQHIGEHRHRLPTFDDANDTLQGSEDLLAGRGELHAIAFCS